MLDAHHGTRARRRAAEHADLARTAIPLDVVRAAPRAGASPGSVAVVGAGFAGCAAAWLAGHLNFDVQLYDAAGRCGGRVFSSGEVVEGRILELGAELIGLNHPLWLMFAGMAGLGLTMVTPEDQQGGGLLQSPLVLGGRSYDPPEQKKLQDEMQKVFDGWIEASKAVTDPWAPWTTPSAPSLDAQSLADNIPAATPAEVVHAIETEWELNNTVPAAQQSWLANLAQLKAGGGQGFLDDTEIFRCAAGNQALAEWLAAGLDVAPLKVNTIDTSAGVTLGFESGEPDARFDYVIVATSVAMWDTITVDGAPFPYDAVQSGPAIKYLAPVDTRFWIPEWLSPSGMSDVLGMTWEGTDNQADTAGFDLTTFAGGSAAKRAIAAGGTDAYFAPLIRQLYPGFSTTGGRFVDWPAMPTIGTGYSCPAPGQVVDVQRTYVTPHNERLFLAGEHTSPAWFGFMEGALQSGATAVIRMADVAGVAY